MTYRYVDVAEAAKMLRLELKNNFPGVRFSVRSDRFAGGSAIVIRWADGPTEGQVREVADRFKGSDFDSMTDSTIMRPDVAINGEEVHFGVNFVECSRRRST